MFYKNVKNYYWPNCIITIALYLRRTLVLLITLQQHSINIIVVKLFPQIRKKSYNKNYPEIYLKDN